MDAPRLQALMTAPLQLGTAVDLRGARVAERVDLTGAVIGNVDLTGTVFDAPVVLRRAKFAGLAWFKACVFAAGLDCREAVFEFDVRFDGAVFSGPVLFARSELRGIAAFDGATFEREADFEGIAAYGNLSCAQTRFRGSASFRDARCAGGLWLDGASFDTAPLINGLDVDGRLSARGAAIPGAVLPASAPVRGA